MLRAILEVVFVPLIRFPFNTIQVDRTGGHVVCFFEFTALLAATVDTTSLDFVVG